MTWWPWSKAREKSGTAPPDPEPEALEIYAEFTLGFQLRPALPITHVFEPIPLDDSLMPGVTVVGRLVYARPAEVVWVERGVPQAAREYEHLPGFQAYVFLTPKADDPDWEEALEKVYRAAVLACSRHEAFGAINSETAQACLCRLAAQASLSEEDRQFQAALEQAELFDLYDPCPDKPWSVSLNALREGPSIYLVDRHLERRYLALVRESGAICLSQTSLVESVLRAYGLTWEREDELEDTALGDHRIVNSKLRKKALAVDFASGRWRGRRLEFPVYGREPLVLDFEHSLVSGPLAEKGSASFSFASLSRADVDEHEVMGDLKVHRYFYLHLSDSVQSLLFVQRMKEYYERSPALRETESRQDLATSVLHSIPAALGVEPRLARKDLVSPRTLRGLTSPI